MRCFIKVTARSSFTRLRAIRWINRAHYHNENILERFTCISLLFKPPCCQTILTLFLSSYQAILTLSQVYWDFQRVNAKQYWPFSLDTKQYSHFHILTVTQHCNFRVHIHFLRITTKQYCPKNVQNFKITHFESN